MDIGTVANCAWAPAALVLLALPASSRPGALRWITLLAAIALADSIATLLPVFDKHLQFAHVHMNWSGKLIDIATMLAIALTLIATRTLKAADIGLTFRQAQGTGRGLLIVAVPFLVLVAALAATLPGTRPSPPEVLAYEATLPGLAEEIVWRGLLLAIFDQLFSGRARVLGAELGYGVIATSLVFGLVHGVGFDQQLVLHSDWQGGPFAVVTGFVLAWLRVRSKSLVVPTLVHNATNLILEGVPRLF